MSMNYPYDPEQVDAPVDVVEGVAQRTHTSLLKGIKNYLRTIATGVAATVSGTVTANQGNQNAGGAAAWHVQAANLDLAITALRDAITGAGVAAKTLANIVTSLNGGLPAALGAGGGLKVDGSGTALSVSGAVTVSGTAYTTPAHTAPTAGVASGAILAANANRKYALFVNDSDTVVYLNLGGAAAANTGIRLNANGGSYEMSALLGNLYTGAVNGISGIAGKVVLVTEGV